jgi:methionyl-tRNA formyltransferase
LEDLSKVQADLFVVVAFGQILPQKLLDIPPLGCINVHASLLPKYRGAAPIQRSILNGDHETGLAIQKMVRELDAGDVIAVKKIAITLLLDVIQQYTLGVPKAQPQDLAQVTYAPKIEPEEGQIRWDQAAQVLQCLIRAFNPSPGAWCWIEINGEKKRLKIFRSKSCERTGVIGKLLPGKDCIVACGQGSLIIMEVQPEGKPRMAAGDWLRGIKGTLQFL